MWAARAGRSRYGTGTGVCTSVPTTVCSCPLPSAPAASTLRTSWQTRPIALESVSRTFHGRDLFAPAAAHLALGVALEDLGPPVDPDALVRLDLPEPALGADRIGAVVLIVDRYGNMQLNVTRRELEEAGIEPGTRVELEFQGERYYATVARAFADASPGDIILYEDSYRNIAVAINRGNAAEMLAARAGQELAIQLAEPANRRLAKDRQTV